MSIKLVALDLDDTLLNSGLEISTSCIEAIKAARKKGVMITLATGRMYRSALPYALQLNIDLPLITYQGAWVKNSLSEEELYYKPVPRQLAREIIQFFKAKGIHCHTYYNDNLCMENLSREGEFYANMARVEPVLMDDLVESLEQYETMKIIGITSNRKMLLDMESELKAKYGQDLYITRSKPCFLEVMNNKATKANALKVIAKHFKLDRGEVMAVGDSYNDVDMLKWAGIGVAMGNAFDQVKEVADFVTSSNEEQGVAEAIRRFVLD